MDLLKHMPLNTGWWCLLLFGMAACQFERGEGDFLPRTSDTGGTVMSGALGGDEPEGDLLNLEGDWLLFIEDRVCIESSLVGDPTENIIWSSYLARIESSNSESSLVQKSLELCGQELSPLPLDLRTVVPRALTDGLPIRDVSGFLVGRAPGSAYVTEAFADLWGVSVLANSETLPDAAEDERVVDQDDDEQPGVTLKVTNDAGDEICEVYVVQRTVFQLEGTVVSRRRIDGEARSISSKTVLASSAALCASGDIAPSFAASQFYLVRIDGQAKGVDLDGDENGSVDCDEVRDGLEETLGAYGVVKSVPLTENCIAPADRSDDG